MFSDVMCYWRVLHRATSFKALSSHCSKVKRHSKSGGICLCYTASPSHCIPVSYGPRPSGDRVSSSLKPTVKVRLALTHWPLCLPNDGITDVSHHAELHSVKCSSWPVPSSAKSAILISHQCLKIVAYCSDGWILNSNVIFLMVVTLTPEFLLPSRS